MRIPMWPEFTMPRPWRRDGAGADAVRVEGRRRGPSTRVRILGWYVVLLGAAIAFGLILQRTILLDQVDDEVSEQLRQEVEELEQLTGGLNPATGEPFGDDVRAIFDTFLSRNIPVEGEALFTIVDGEPYASTVTPLQLLDDREVVEEWAAVETSTRGALQTEQGEVRYLAVPVRRPGGSEGVFVVSIFMDEKISDVNSVLQTGLIIYGSTFVVASIIAWFAAGRVLRPLRLLTGTAHSIGESNWSERIPVHGDDEIAELTQTFNEMLDRLEVAFETQRRFIDDAGHELRTPITIVRGHLELLGDEPAERDETMRLVMDELDRMARMVDELLLLARAEQADFLDPRPIDVAELTEDVAAKAAPVADRGWLVEEAAQVVLIGDRQRLTQAMMNLARNAVEHTPDGTAIAVGSRLLRDQVALWVHDEGPGIEAGEMERIFQRFARGRTGQRSTEGAGLGLAIVRAIAEAHGGRVTVESSPIGGTRFTMFVPLRGPTEADG